MSQLILNLDNKELEESLKKFAKKHKKALEQVAIEAIKQFINLSEGKKEKHIQKDLADTKAYSHHSANLIEEWKEPEEDEIWK